jgi:GntR family transcriptional regulator
MEKRDTVRGSLSRRLHDELARVIEATNPGDRLPTEPKLAHQMGVSRATLREAMRTFETQGLLRRRQGVGTFVVRPQHVLDSGLEVLESIETLALRSGLRVMPGELEVELRLAKEAEAQALGIKPGIAITQISRVILAENHPVAYLQDVLPVEVLSPDEIANGFRGSVLDLLVKRGNPQLVNSHCEIAAVAATSDISRALNIQRGDSLLRFESRLFSAEGAVIDYSLSYFLPGYFRFHVVRQLA